MRKTVYTHNSDLQGQYSNAYGQFEPVRYVAKFHPGYRLISAWKPFDGFGYAMKIERAQHFGGGEYDVMEDAT